jgi:hypothetical protein
MHGDLYMIPFRDYCARVQEHLEQDYAIRVVTSDIPDPLTGDLDGSEIHVDYALTPEQRLFLLAHLFGHTVQWNMDPGAIELGRPLQVPVDQALLLAIMEYEREAGRYALFMLHAIGITGVDQWFSDYTSCDMAYLSHYYRTGVKQEFLSFWRDSTPLIESKAVPRFTPTRRTLHLDGIVI